MRREARVESILAAAARAFGRKGFAATSMEEIAAEAGITKLIVYRHFGGKKELYEAVLARVSERLVEAFRAAAAERTSGIAVKALLTVAREDTDAFLLLFRHAAREPEFAPYAEEYLARVTKAAEGVLSARVADPVLLQWTARVMVRTNIEGVISWLEVGETARDDEFIERVDRMARAMVQSIGDA